MVFLGLSREKPEWHLKIRQDCFFPHPFISLHFSYHLALRTDTIILAVDSMAK